MNDRRRLDEKTLYAMQLIYCSAKHAKDAGEDGLCDPCRDLLKYSLERTKNCSYKAQGRLCSACEIHCFENEQRARIRQVMRFSGPRLIFRKPALALRYLFLRVRQAHLPKGG